MDAWCCLSAKGGELVRHGPAGCRAAGKNVFPLKLPDLLQRHFPVTLVPDGRFF